jgi:hypothetical protein
MAGTIPAGVDLATTPVRKPPPGFHSNFIDPPSMASGVTATAVVLIVLSTFFVATRLYLNYTTPRKLGWDDCSFLLFPLALSES